MKLCLFKTAMLKHENAEVEAVSVQSSADKYQTCVHAEKEPRFFLSHDVSDNRFVLVLAHSMCL